MKSSGFSKAERLARSAVIQTVFRKGKKYSCDGAKLFVLANGMGRNRVVFTFPRGYGSAVQRNYSRRLSREVYRLMKQYFITGYDFTVLVFREKMIFMSGKDSLSFFSKNPVYGPNLNE